MADFKGRKKGKSHVQNMGIFFGAKFQLIINFFRVKAISTGLSLIFYFIVVKNTTFSQVQQKPGRNISLLRDLPDDY